MDGVKIRSFGDADQTPGPWSTGGGRQKRLCRAGRGIRSLARRGDRCMAFNGRDIP
jgi:hypothetical protein